MGGTEIADLLGVSRQRADQLSRTDSFPTPLGEVAAGRIWRRSDVEAWAHEQGRT
jgi:predicted DNA-binding transcriptional regulator AlpA